MAGVWATQVSVYPCWGHNWSWQTQTAWTARFSPPPGNRKERQKAETCAREQLTPKTVKSLHGRKHGETERSPEGKCYDSRTHFNGYIIPQCCKIRAIAVNYYAMLPYSQQSRMQEVITAFCCVICCFIMAIDLIQEAANDDYSELIFPQYMSWLWLTFTISVNA